MVWVHIQVREALPDTEAPKSGGSRSGAAVARLSWPMSGAMLGTLGLSSFILNEATDSQWQRTALT